MNEKELYHYGILGMKWGIRRYQAKLANQNWKLRKYYGRRVAGYSE